MIDLIDDSGNFKCQYSLLIGSILTSIVGKAGVKVGTIGPDTEFIVESLVYKFEFGCHDAFITTHMLLDVIWD